MQGVGVRLPARSNEEHHVARDADILQLRHERVHQPRLHNNGTVIYV